MILIYHNLWLILGALLAWIAGRWSTKWPRYISLFTLGGNLILMSVVWVQYLLQTRSLSAPQWIYDISFPWIPQIGAQFHLALDGLSLLLILLANLLGVAAILASWKEINYQVGFFHFNLIVVLTALQGVFVALDLLLFYFFWEIMLVPLYFLIGIWGHERRIYAAIKFFLFTQFSSLLMLLSILGLYFVHGTATGVYTFDYHALLGTPMSSSVAFWLMMGFFIAFAVKLPAFPLHTWLPDAHTEAPTAGSVDLAGLVLKVAGYGFIRFLIPLFPGPAQIIAPYAMILGVIGILYGAILAFSQTNLKRLVAYTSVSHMGFVLLGIFAMHRISLQGSIIIMLSHGISTGALFILVGQLYERMHTRELSRMGGLWETVPRLGRVGLFFALASLGLPGIGNFVGEFLVLLGVYETSPVIAGVATIGFILATVYSLWMMQRIFTGRNLEGWKLPDMTARELGLMSSLIVILVWIGVFPQPFLNTSRAAVEAVEVSIQRVQILDPRLLATVPKLNPLAHIEGLKSFEKGTANDPE